MEISGNSQLSDREIETEIERLQLGLRGYVISILGATGDIDEVIQQTNLFVWDKRSDFTPGTSFKAWAFSVARYKTMEVRRAAIKRGHVAFCEETVERISTRAEEKFSDDTDRMLSLRSCVSQMKQKEQHMILEFYMKENSLTAYAETIGKSVSAVHKAVSRIRLKLRDCINKKLTKSS